MPATRPGPCIIVIFGASGDLTSRKLIPALWEMALCCDLPEATCIVGVSRSELSDDAWRDRLETPVRQHAREFNAEAWRSFAQRIFYVSADATRHNDMIRLAERVEELNNRFDVGGSILFYLSVKPSLYEPIIEQIDRAGMVTEGKRWCALDREHAPWQRIIVEKPFGHDLDSAASLNRGLGRVFEEESIFRIDHYLGKELVQNLLILRFANSIFEPVWSHQYVDHVQITAAETDGVEDRASYYDEAGAIRDMIQSHLMQVMALVAMEPPTSFTADHVRQQKIQILDAIAPTSRDELRECAALGQYAAGGDHSAYHEIEGVAADSKTETFAAVKFHFDNWRWSGTPFYLRSGKRLAAKRTEIVIQFRRPPADLFGREESAMVFARPANRLIIEIAPDPGVSLRFEGKVPGPGLRIDTVKMDFGFVRQFGEKPVEAYGPLLLDCMRGDQTLFPHRLEVEAAWRAVMPFIGDESDILRRDIRANYAPGSWGPKSADDLLTRDGRTWRRVSR